MAFQCRAKRDDFMGLYGDSMGFDSDLMGFTRMYPLVMTNIAMKNGPFFFVDFPFEHGNFQWLCQITRG